MRRTERCGGDGRGRDPLWLVLLRRRRERARPPLAAGFGAAGGGDARDMAAQDGAAEDRCGSDGRGCNPRRRLVLLRRRRGRAQPL
jgi:hypothetical protein